MRVFNGLEQFSRFIGDLAIISAVAPATVVGRIARVGYDKALELYGDQIKLQPPLAPSTQTERVRLGYSPADPLLRSGGLRSELEFEHRGLEAGYGSSDPVQLYQEVGTPKIPPRALLRISVQETEVPMWIAVRETVATMIGTHTPLSSVGDMTLGGQLLRIK